VRERAVTFGSHGGLIGILCEPDGGGRAGAPAVLMFNVGLNHRVGPGRLHVELARELARRGFPSLRFDVSGLGDSEPRRDSQLGDVERAALDLSEAMDFLQRRIGAAGFVLSALCSGTDAAHVIALRDPRVLGAVFMDGYAYPTSGYHLRRVLQKLGWAFAPFRWRRFLRRRRRRLQGQAADADAQTGAPEPVFDRSYPPLDDFRRDVDTMVARGVQLLFVYTGEAWFFNHRSQFLPMLGWRALPPDVTVDTWPAADHSFSTLAARRALVRRVGEWLEARFPGAEAEPLRQARGG
jgi:hypothetical protein